MIYLDTSLIISFMDVKDPNHELAEEMLEDVEDGVVSRLVLVELSSVYSRAGLKSPLALALHSIRSVDARLVEVNFNDVLRMAFKLSPKLGLKTLDLLHVTAAHSAGAQGFATIDLDIVRRSSIVRKELGIEVLGPRSHPVDG